MITLAGVFGQLAAWFGRMAEQLDPTMDSAIADALDRLIQDLMPVTPVRSGAMQADYTIATGAAGGVWYLLDTAESPAGFDYPERIFSGATPSAGTDPLNAVLDAAIATLPLDLDAAITRLVAHPL